MIDASAPASASQFLPAIAVNDSGVVGVMWLDTRASSVEVRMNFALAP